MPRRLTPQMVSGIDPKQASLPAENGGCRLLLVTVFANVLVYASIGEALGLPIHIVLAPEHAFVRWRLDGSSYINWETSTGAVMTNSEYVAWRHISDAAIKNGVYMSADLSPRRYLAWCTTISGSSGAAVGRDWRTSIVAKDEASADRKSDRESDPCDRVEQEALRGLSSAGKVLVHLKDVDKAIADDSLAIHLDPDQPAAYFGRGARLPGTRAKRSRTPEDIKKAIRGLR